MKIKDIKTPIDFKLKAGCSYDAKRRTFHLRDGNKVSIRGVLPLGSRVVFKFPGIPWQESKYLYDLARYMQVILPKGASLTKYLRIVRSWPSVERADRGPDVSLPR